MRQNFKLIIEYDGKAYHGWQRQKELPTVQGTIETALATMTGQSVTVTGSGRTDAGVHALNQVASFAVETQLSGDSFKNGLNSLVPSDIVIKDCQSVPESFHARYDVSSKVYEYAILNRFLPAAIFRQYAWHVRKALDVQGMSDAAALLEGTHDFSAFEGAGSPRSNSVRTVMAVGLQKKDNDYLIFTIEADGFLRCMVRNIVGTLVDVGRAKTSTARFRKIFESKDRNQAGATAPPQGLFLKEVKY
jgi:tRNA pseudouridine38-40 synthase